MQCMSRTCRNKAACSWKMATFGEAREALLIANDLNLIDEDEVLLLSKVKTSKNLDNPFWRYDTWDLDSLTDDECISEFRFLKQDIYGLLEVLDLPDKITCPNHFSVCSDEALCLLLWRFAYPCRYKDLVYRFGRPVPQLSMVVNEMMHFLYTRYGHHQQVWPVFVTLFIERGLLSTTVGDL